MGWHIHTIHAYSLTIYTSNFYIKTARPPPDVIIRRTDGGCVDTTRTRIRTRRCKAAYGTGNSCQRGVRIVCSEPGESLWSFAIDRRTSLDAMDRSYGPTVGSDVISIDELRSNQIHQHSDLAQFMVDLYYFIKCDERGRACRGLVRLAHELVVGALRSCARCRSSFVNNGMTPYDLAGKGKSKKNQKVNGCVGGLYRFTRVNGRRRRTREATTRGR